MTNDTTTDVQPEVSRRWLGKAVLLGGASATVAAVEGAAPAEAATGSWNLNGNSGITGQNFLGPLNSAALLIKTSPAGTPVECARFTPQGRFIVRGDAAIGVGLSTVARLNVATTSNAGTAVLGTSPNSISNALSALGVQGVGTIGVQGTGEYMGVNGSSLNYAVFGATNPDTGGIGTYGRGAQGVKGRSYSGYAVYGDTDDGTGVKGEAYSNGDSVKAIHGQNFGSGGSGVVGEASSGSTAFGVWGISSTGYAGAFSGNVLITGTVSKGGGSFKIDHPLDPANKYLYHSFVESPDMMNVYNGNVRTDARGRATVRLPDYFMALNKDFRYQLTVIGTFARAIVGKEIEDGEFEIHTDEAHVKVSWQVTGIRQDAFANANRIPVSQDKPRNERGKFLHPAVFGKSASLDVQHERLVGLRANAIARQQDPVGPR